MYLTVVKPDPPFSLECRPMITSVQEVSVDT